MKQGYDDVGKDILIASFTEFVTESLQEGSSIYGVEAATGYTAGKDANLNNGSTYFLRPYNRGSTHDDFGGTRYNEGGASLFKAEEGKLLIWPSFLMHGSKPYLGDKDRIIISANADVNIVN